MSLGFYIENRTKFFQIQFSNVNKGHNLVLSAQTPNNIVPQRPSDWDFEHLDQPQ